jgi:hypothetical protein
MLINFSIGTVDENENPHALSLFAKDPNTNEVEARRASEIRIYCDNNKRWELRGDDPDQEEGERNSARDEERQEWIDHTNQIITYGKAAETSHDSAQSS